MEPHIEVENWTENEDGSATIVMTLDYDVILHFAKKGIVDTLIEAAKKTLDETESSSRKDFMEKTNPIVELIFRHLDSLAYQMKNKMYDGWTQDYCKQSLIQIRNKMDGILNNESQD